MIPNERQQALSILVRVIEDKIPLSHLLQREPYTAFTKALCFGVCRQYFRLEKLAETLMDKRPKSLELWVLLLMGLYQLQFLNKPAYAVVKETVELAEVLKKDWAKGLVNAVLRRFCRDQLDIIGRLEPEPCYHFGHPAWMLAQIKKDWPFLWQEILIGNDAHPPMSLRVNRLQITRAQYLNHLSEVGLAAECLNHSSVGVRLDAPIAVMDLPGFREGQVSVQDESAQLVVPLLDLKPGLRVLDACAAPGGKTCHLLEAEPKLAECVALDIEAKRITRIHENLNRLRLKATVLQGDASRPESWWDGQLFDRILLDAPCSATGVIRRHPDIKLLRTAKEIQSIAEVQALLLNRLWPLLKTGGLLVYSTCSIMQQENDAQIGLFLNKNADAQRLIFHANWGRETTYGRQMLPGQDNADGFFYSVLIKG